MSSALPFRHFLLGLAVVAVWGLNFVVIRVALDDLPPLLLAVLRFAFVLLPAIFFLKRPNVPWRHLAAYGVMIGAGQFGILYFAMTAHISPGIASLVLQSQVFFTIGLAMLLDGERVRPFQWTALTIATAGFVVILTHTDGSTTAFGLALGLTAAFSWAGGNMVARQSGTVNQLAYVVWASLFSLPPLIVASLVLDGPDAIAAGFARADIGTWAAVLWQSVGNTMFGYAAWGFLLARYPAATVTPMALLVPVFGMSGAALLLDEPLPAWKLIAAALVLTGLAVNLLWPRLTARLLKTPPAA